MENAPTIEKLKDAINNLIKAHGSLNQEMVWLQDESLEIQKESENLKKDIKDLEEINLDLETKLTSLTTTSNATSTEMDELLNKIDSVLSVSPSDNQPETIASKINDEDCLITPEDLNKDIESVVEEFHNEKNKVKDLDLNRMKSLLNGFNK